MVRHLQLHLLVCDRLAGKRSRRRRLYHFQLERDQLCGIGLRSDLRAARAEVTTEPVQDGRVVRSLQVARQAVSEKI